MTLQLSKGKPYKAYVKKLQNGFGIKTINTATGVENIVIITADSNQVSHSDEKTVIDSEQDILRPLVSKFSEDTLSASLPLASVNKPNCALNQVLAHLEPCLREIKTDISGFHIFDEGTTKCSPNVQKTSVIFVANTQLARRKGVHFNIPGELMNVFVVEDQDKEGKTTFKADPVVKPLTIVVSDYVLHINICYDLPPKPQIKTVGTQTKKRYVLTSSVDDNAPVYKIESLPLSDLQVKLEQKYTQTESSVFTEESQSKSDPSKHYQENSIQTVFFKDGISYTSASSSDKKSYSLGDKSGLNTDEGNTRTESFENSSKQTVDFENSLNSFTSYDSHTNLHLMPVSRNVTDERVYKTTSVENKEVEENVKTRTTTDSEKDKKTLTLFDNSSNYHIEITNSDNAFENIEAKYSGYSPVHTSTKSASFEEGRSGARNSDSVLAPAINIENGSNVSIKDIKERLNKTTVSLQQLYSVIELMENQSDRSEATIGSAGYSEREPIENKVDMSRQTSTVTSSQATLEESTSINSSDQSLNSHKMTSRSSSKSGYEKSLKEYKDVSSADILCERCGVFHTEGYCKIVVKENIKPTHNKGCPGSTGSINSGSSVGQEHLSKNVSAITNVIPDEMEGYVSSDTFNETQSLLETKVKDSTISCIRHNNLMINEPNIYKKSIEDNTLLNSDNGGLNKNHNQLAIEKLSDKTVINRKEFDRNDISIFDHNLADIDKVDNPSSQTLREIKDDKNKRISSKGNCMSEECIETMSEREKSIENLTSSCHVTSEEDSEDHLHNTSSNYKNIELKDGKESNAAQRSEVSSKDSLPNSFIQTKSEKSSNTTFIDKSKSKAKENGKVLYFAEVKNTKSWISFKKSSQSFHSSKKLDRLKRKTTPEPNTNRKKLKTLSSGDHLRENETSKVSGSLEGIFHTIGLFNNKSNFLNYKYSSSSTLHIAPSSQELLKVNSQESSFRDFSKKSIGRVERETESFEKRYTKSKGDSNKRKDDNLAYTRYNQFTLFGNKLAVNKTDLKTSNNSKPAKIITKNTKQNSKQKKSRWFCFLV